MKKLLITALVAISIFLTPMKTFAKGIELSPVEYKVAKKYASDLCEAKGDGLTISSAFEVAAKGVFLSTITSGYISEDMFEVDTTGARFAEFVLAKTQKDCFLGTKEVQDLKNLFEETAIAAKAEEKAQEEKQKAQEEMKRSREEEDIKNIKDENERFWAYMKKFP